MEQFTNLYPVSKTLRFELQPVGRTKENMERGGILQRDIQRADEYKKIKGFIDEYHKRFINGRLSAFRLPFRNEGYRNSLEEYQALYEIKRRNEAQEEEFAEVKTNLRKLIVDRLTSCENYKRLFKKELIREDLPNSLENEEDKEVVRRFEKFTSSLTGFYSNRANMYSPEEKSTAIAYRIIHQNLPKFMDNMTSFSKIAQSSVADHFLEIYEGWKEFLNVEKLEDVFRLDYFSETLTQPHIEVYNYIIGKKILEDGTEIKGINEYVNLYNQQQTDKSQRLPLLIPLYKQILSDREKLSWLTGEFTSDEEMVTAIKEYFERIDDLVLGDGKDSLYYLLKHLSDFDLDRINITNDSSLTSISQSLFGKYDVLTKSVKDAIKLKTPRKKRESEEDYEGRIAKGCKSRKSFSISELDRFPQPEVEKGESRRIEDYFMSLGIGMESTQEADLFTRIKTALADVQDILQRSSWDDTLSQNKAAVAKLKTLLDAVKDLQHFVCPLLGSREEIEKDNLFYGRFNSVWEELDTITPLYNKVRNWLTRKPYSVEKVKLTFNNSQLLGGWDVNKEPDCTAVLLRKDGLYYLGIMDKKSNHVFEADVTPSNGDTYDKIDYKLLPGANKMLPKVFFSKSRIDEFAPSEAIISSYKRGTHKKGKDFNLSECHRLIDFFKQSIQKHEDWSKFGFHFSDTQTYDDIGGFYREVEDQGYMLSTHPVSSAYIYQLVDEGKLYLFRIWNKDFSEHSKGTPNLHTLYWKMLFDERNLSDVVYKLNGDAEIFFRKASIKEKNRIIHRAHEEIANKNILNKKEKSLFDYDIVKDRRYTVDKFQFHVPITINFKAAGRDNINPVVLGAIREGVFSHIIGIDRGERHLLYLSLIDMQGNIVRQMSLNEIVNEYNGLTHKTNYHDLLVKREGERKSARQSWDTIEVIKDIKEGYLSQVVHIISRMMVQYKAIVVLEDLNSGFIRGRQRIERQVYEKFERALIDKLNCFVDKQSEVGSPGGLLHPLQLASKFESFSNLGRQSGCLFYIPAWNTSKIDPVTGFVNLFDLRYETRDKSRDFFSRFRRIEFNSKKQWFEFTFDYEDFTEKAYGTRTEWTLCSYGTRIRTFRDPLINHQWNSEEVVLTDEFRKLFENYDIDIYGDLKESIIGQDDAQFFKKLTDLMKLLLQIRNSKAGSDIDYLLSPVADNTGRFFDSREQVAGLPDNADANGAYNIARKGLWLVRKIQGATENEKIKLTITNKEWLQFAQTKPYIDA